MESCPLPRTPPFLSSFSSRNKSIFHLPIPYTNKFAHKSTSYLLPSPPTHLTAALQSPRGFGPSPKKKSKSRPRKPTRKDEDDGSNEDEEEVEDDREVGVIPEVVTNRMLSRIGFSVGTPLFIGLLFFPFFYYLKVGLKIDVPTWVPFIVSFIFFGSALAGVSYGIVSASWDPLREGSLLGWTEAKRNWPVFWQSLRGRSGRN